MNKLHLLAIVILASTVPVRALAACGDGRIDGTDVCDDGNVVAGDGCSATCTRESGFTCRTQLPVTIVNGSFETDPFAVGGGWTELSVNDTDRVDANYIDSGPPNFDTVACWPAGDGRFSIDMNGAGTQGTLYQQVTTVPGQRYVMTFLGNANPVDVAGASCGGAATKALTVRVADGTDPLAATQAQVFDLVRLAGVRDDWRLQSYEFVALSATTTIVFQGSAPDFNGPMIDRVAIPESVCTLDSCGNGTLGAGEACDDGNHNSGDGCSATCVVEPGYDCTTAGSACVASMCGDGIVAGTEECDDDGSTSGDGCSATCTTEPGWSCIYVGHYMGMMGRSVCTMTCGDGTLDLGEECDDHNTVDRDACSNTCLLGPGEPCLLDGACALGSCAAVPGDPSMLRCAGCYDTQTPNMGTVPDFGCTVAQPACDASSGTPMCFICLVDGDCPTGLFCNLTARACMPRVDVDMGLPPFDVGPPPFDVGPPPFDVGPPPFDVGPPPFDAGRDAATGPDVGMDASSSPDAGPRVGGAAGGACSCTVQTQHAPGAWQALVALGAIGLLVRRRARRSAR